MSAYLCDPADFVALARYAKRPCNGFNGYNLFTKERIGGDDGELNVRDIALKLATANICSVAYRYPREPFGGFLKNEEEMVEFMCEVAQKARKSGLGVIPPSDSEAFMLAARVEYQSCERDDWIEQDAYWILQSIQNDASRKMAQAVEDLKEVA